MRVRGVKNVKSDIKQTLLQMHLTRKNSCLVVEGKAQWIEGALQKTRNYITWGELDEGALKELHSKRKAEASIERKGVKTSLFRLNNPIGGWKSVKNHFPKGDLGNRGDKIGVLIKKMLH